MSTLAAVQFERRLREGLHDGTITVAFRRWQRRQVAAGGRYRTGAGIVEAIAVDVIDPAAITDSDAVRAGYVSAGAARADLRGSVAGSVFRVEFRVVDEPDPRTVLGQRDRLDADERAALDARLARMGQRWAGGPTPHEILRQIGEHPGVVSTELAAAAGCERPEYKRRVRLLKEAGLTLSREVGYELSPRGRAYLVAD